MLALRTYLYTHIHTHPHPAHTHNNTRAHIILRQAKDIFILKLFLFDGYASKILHTRQSKGENRS